MENQTDIEGLAYIEWNQNNTCFIPITEVKAKLAKIRR